jgi:pimeloyl-ACP methyl ester carboxylesterase
MAAYCLLHGNWHDAESWEPLIVALLARGHDAVAPDLPIDDPEAGWDERVASAMAALQGIEGTVVVVVHSATSGVGALLSSQLDDPLLVYLCPRLGHLQPPPDAPEPFRPGFPFPPRRPDGASVWDRDAAIAAMYGRLPRETAEALADRLRPAAPPRGGYPLTGNPKVATALVYASEDEFFEPEWERLMAREVLGVEPIELSGGHFPMLEDPERLAGVLDRLARRHDERRR